MGRILSLRGSVIVGVGIRGGGGGGEGGKAVVSYTSLEVGAQEDVGGLEIAVDKPPRLVDVGEALGYVLCYFQA